MSEAEEMLSFRQRMQLFTSPDGECYATFEIDGRKQTQQIGWTCLCRSFKTRGECSRIVAVEMLMDMLGVEGDGRL